MNNLRQKLIKVTSALIKHYGIPEKNRNPVSPLTALIGTILSQNTNDNNSYRAYQALIKAYPRWEMLKDVPASKIEKIIKSAGLAKQKSAAINNIADSVFVKKTLLLDSGILELQSTDEILKSLIALPGVGVKTASCVLLFSMQRDICPVDTHVHRVLNRLGAVKTGTPDRTFFCIKDSLPKGKCHALHTNLIRLGRQYCKPSLPACLDCPLNIICNYTEKNMGRSIKFADKKFMLLDSL